MTQLRPAHKTMAPVRRDQLQLLRLVCRACTLLGQPRNLFAGAWGASDGRTGKAGQAHARTLSHRLLRRLLQQIEARLEASLQARERGESEEDHGAPGGVRAAHGTRQARRSSSVSSCMRPTRGSSVPRVRTNSRGLPLRVGP